MKNLLPVLFLLFSLILSAQTDVRQVGEMPEGVWETSGLLFHKERLITHNDSGNSAQLFEIDTVTMAITRRVTISNSENVDWEDIAQDETFIYIADFGNNVGTRQDLRVYRISKSTYDTVDTVPAEEIGFAYEDQTDFSDSGNSDWDAEALFVLNDQLIILTKQWKSNNTVVYTIPKIPGSHTARRLDNYNINGLVTGASYNQQTGLLHVLGYDSLLGSFVYRVIGISETAVFGGTIERLETNIGFAQTEGITFVNDEEYLISSERFVNEERGIELSSLLLAFKTTDSQPQEPEPQPEPEPENDGAADFFLFRQSGSNELQYQLVTDQPVLGWAIFDTTGRRISFLTQNSIENTSIDVATLHPAIYYFNLYLGDKTLSSAFAVD